MAQIHSALALYYEHQAELDAEIQRDFEEYTALRAAAGESPARKKRRDLDAQAWHVLGRRRTKETARA